MAILTAKDLCASYEGKRVLTDISFEVDRGNCLCVVGENGVGKSTLIRCLTGMVKPDSGSITYGEGVRPSTIGYLPQQGEYRPEFPSTVKEIVRSGLIGRKRAFIWFGDGEKERVRSALERLGISDLRDRRYCDLSGGQKQRVLLARTLVASDSVMVLDEPTIGLDAVATAELYETVRQIHESGVTVVMSASDAKAALLYATHILQLRGRALFYGAAQEYLRSDVGFSYLNRPSENE